VHHPGALYEYTESHRYRDTRPAGLVLAGLCPKYIWVLQELPETLLHLGTLMRIGIPNVVEPK
jgi:hypothetical protein